MAVTLNTANDSGAQTGRRNTRKVAVDGLTNKVQSAYASFLRREIEAARSRDKKRELTAELAAFEKRRGLTGLAPSAHGFVYFLGGEDTPIKIGFSVSPSKRRAELQTGHWGRLEILAVTPGSAKQEAAYHARFAEQRISGEWFSRHPDILAEIARLSPQTVEAVS